MLKASAVSLVPHPSLDLDLEPGLDALGTLWISLSFAGGSVRGSVSPTLRREGAESPDTVSSWRPLEGTFPPGPCPGAAPVDLDAPFDIAGGSLRAALARVASRLDEAALIEALWLEGAENDGAGSTPPAFARTQVTLSVGGRCSTA
jgi:hypothetical protein